MWIALFPWGINAVGVSVNDPENPWMALFPWVALFP